MAVFNLAGGLIGARMALSKGSEFVRGVLLVVVFSLVAEAGVRPVERVSAPLWGGEAVVVLARAGCGWARSSRAP